MLSSKQRKTRNRKIAFGIIGIILIIAISITAILSKNNDKGDIRLASINGDENNQKAVTREPDIVKPENSKQVEIVVAKGGTNKTTLEMSIKDPILWGLGGFYFLYDSFFVDTDLREDWELYNENDQTLIPSTGTTEFEDSTCKARVFIEDNDLKVRVQGLSVGQSKFMVRVRHEDESPEHLCYLSSHQFRVTINVRDDLIPSGAKIVHSNLTERDHEDSAGLVEYGKPTYVVMDNLNNIAKLEVGIEPTNPQTPTPDQEGYVFAYSSRWREWQQTAQSWVTVTCADENSNIFMITPKKAPDKIDGRQAFKIYVYTDSRQSSAGNATDGPFIITGDIVGAQDLVSISMKGLSEDSQTNEKWINKDSAECEVTFSSINGVSGFTKKSVYTSDGVGISDVEQNEQNSEKYTFNLQFTDDNDYNGEEVEVYIPAGKCQIIGTLGASDSRTNQKSNVIKFKVDRKSPVVDNVVAEQNGENIIVTFDITENNKFKSGTNDITGRDNIEWVKIGEQTISRYTLTNVQSNDPKVKKYKLEINNSDKLTGKFDFKLKPDSVAENGIQDVAGNGLVAYRYINDSRVQNKLVVSSAEGPEPTGTPITPTPGTPTTRPTGTPVTPTPVTPTPGVPTTVTPTPGTQVQVQLEFKKESATGEKITPDSSRIVKTNGSVYVKASTNKNGVEAKLKITREGDTAKITENSVSEIQLTEEGKYIVQATTENASSNQYAIYIDKTAPTIAFSKSSDSITEARKMSIEIADNGGEGNISKTAQTGVNANKTYYFWGEEGYTAKDSDFTAQEDQYRGKFLTANTTINVPDKATGKWVLWIKTEDKVGNVKTENKLVDLGENNSEVIVNNLEAGTMNFYTVENENQQTYTAGTFTTKNVKMSLVTRDFAKDKISKETYKIARISKDGKNESYKLLAKTGENFEEKTAEEGKEYTEEVMLTEDGIYTITVSTTSSIDTSKTSTRQYLVKIDKTAPVITINSTENNGLKLNIEDAKYGVGLNASATRFIWARIDKDSNENVTASVNKVLANANMTAKDYLEAMLQNKAKLEQQGIYLAEVEAGEKLELPKVAGKYALYVYAEDKLGNGSIETSKEIKVEKTEEDSSDSIDDNGNPTKDTTKDSGKTTDKTTASKEIPNTGKATGIIAIIGVAVAVAFVSYKKYMKYKKIK